MPVDPGQKVTLKQPDGRSFIAHPFGDEWYHGFETLRGFTVLRDPGSRSWRYAERTDGGRLTPGEVSASSSPPRGLRPHLRDQARVETAKRFQAGQGQDGPSTRDGVVRSPTPANTGTQPTLVILVEFNDVTHTTNESQWATRWFDNSVGADSVRRYYEEASYGQLHITPAPDGCPDSDSSNGVVGWLHLNENKPDASQLSTQMPNAQKVVGDAISGVDSVCGINFAQYDKNGNGTLTADELHITVIPAGGEASSGCPAPGVWGHKYTAASQIRTVDGVRAGYDYTIFGEIHCNGTGPHMAAKGIMVHELGHDLDLPDLYDGDYSTKGGVGYWSDMAYGSWLAGSGHQPGADPPNPDAFSRYYEGWTNPMAATGTIALARAEDNPAAVRLRPNPNGVDWTFSVHPGTGEYYLVENRQKVGNDVALPGCGFLMWHIDETAPSTGSNNDENHRLVQLVEADNNNNPFEGGDRWLSGTFDDNSTPSARLYGGGASGARVTSMPGACGSTMTANFSDGSSAPQAPVNDNFLQATGLNGSDATRTTDTNVGATKESGEPNHTGDVGGKSVWYRWKAPTGGQVTIDTTGSGFDTTLAVYNDAGAVNSLGAAVASNDDIDQNTAQSSVTFTPVANQTYRIAVDGFKGGNASAAQGAVHVALHQTGGGPAGPANDNFANATDLGTGSSASRPADTNVGATKEGGEPNISANPGGASVWYRWTPAVSGSVTISTAGSAPDTLLGIYTGSSVGSLTSLTENDDIDPGAGNLQSAVTFSAVAGTTYRIAVDGYNDNGSGAATGNLQLTLNQASVPAPANDNFAAASSLGTGTTATISSDTNQGATKQLGEPNHADNPGGSSVWYTWQPAQAGQVTLTTSGADFDTILGVYTGSAVNGLAPVASNDDFHPQVDTSSGVTFNVSAADVAASKVYRIAVDGYATDTGPATGTVKLNLSEATGSAPANDDITNAQTLSGTDLSVNGTNSLATKETDEPDHADNQGGASVWYSWTAPATGGVDLYTDGSDFDTLLAIYTGGPTMAGLDPVDFNDDEQPGSVTQSFVFFRAVAGETYWFAVDGYKPEASGASVGNIQLQLYEDYTPPVTHMGSVSINRRKRSARIRFSATDNNPYVHFLCKIDGKSYGSCRSPKTYRHLRRGRHRFYVRAIDDYGNRDASPAVKRFRIR